MTTEEAIIKYEADISCECKFDSRNVRESVSKSSDYPMIYCAVCDKPFKKKQGKQLDFLSIFEIHITGR